MVSSPNTHNQEEIYHLYEISRVVNSSLDLKTVLQFIMDMTTKLFKADAGSIMLLQKEKYLTIEVSQGLSQEVISSTKVLLGEGIAGWVALKGEPLLLDGKVADSKFKRLIPRKEEIQSSLCVPLKTNNKVIGVLMLRNPSRSSHFTETDLKFLTTIGDQVSIAIEHARLYAEVRKATEMKSQFVSMVTHDLKTPITSIQGFVEIILTRNPPLEKIHGYLQIVREETERLVRIINNLLDLAKLEAGEFKLNRVPVNLVQLIHEALPILSKKSQIHKIHFQPPESIPDVWADQDLIIQVIYNLLSNAIKYSPEGGKIEIRISTMGDFVEIDIEDEGIGIPPGKLAKLFEKFYRVNSELTQGIEGTGIGLANVKYIIEAHGGSIKVKSQEGRGSLFAFFLPVFSRHQKDSHHVNKEQDAE
jgi:signal transduction histidine kinase